LRNSHGVKLKLNSWRSGRSGTVKVKQQIHFVAKNHFTDLTGMKRRSNASLTRSTTDSVETSGCQQDTVEDYAITNNHSESSSSHNHSIEPDESRTSLHHHYHEDYTSPAIPLCPTVPTLTGQNLPQFQEPSNIHPHPHPHPHPDLFYDSGQNQSANISIADGTYHGGSGTYEHQVQGGQTPHAAYSNPNTNDPLIQRDSMQSTDRGMEPQHAAWPIQFDTSGRTHSISTPPRSRPPFPPQQPYATQSPMYSRTHPYPEGYYQYPYPPHPPPSQRYDAHSQPFVETHGPPLTTTPQPYHTSPYPPPQHQYHSHNAPYYNFTHQNQQLYTTGDYDCRYGQPLHSAPPFAQLPHSQSARNSPEGPHKIKDYNHNDVLCGRGGATNSHPGNKAFRKLVKEYKGKYLKAKKKEKPEVAEHVVNLVRGLDPPGRFLKKVKASEFWIDIGDTRAKEKTSQALREGAPMIRKKKAHHNADEEDEMEAMDPSFTSSEGSSPDKSIASEPMKYETIKEGSIGIREKSNRKNPSTRHQKSADIGEEHAEQPVETLKSRLKIANPDSSHTGDNATSKTGKNKKLTSIHHDGGSDADISDSGCSVYSSLSISGKNVGVNIGNVCQKRKRRKLEDMPRANAVPAISIPVTKRTMVKVDTTKLTQEDLSLYNVFEPPNPCLREESVRTEEEKRSLMSDKEV